MYGVDSVSRGGFCRRGNFRRSRLLLRVISGACADDELAFTFRRQHVNVDASKCPVLGCIGGVVSQSVLIPNIARDLFADRTYFIEGLWKVRRATRNFG